MELTVFTLKLMDSLACDWAFETGACSMKPRLASIYQSPVESPQVAGSHFNFIWRFQNKEQSRYLRYFSPCNSVVIVWLRDENETVCILKPFPRSTEQLQLRTLRQQSFNISWWVQRGMASLIQRRPSTGDLNSNFFLSEYHFYDLWTLPLSLFQICLGKPISCGCSSLFHPGWVIG